MIKTIALGLLFLGLLYSFAAGVQTLAGSECSDWLTTCKNSNVAARLDAPDTAPDLRGDDH